MSIPVAVRFYGASGKISQRVCCSSTQKTFLPDFQPMPLGRARDPFSHPDWIFEINGTAAVAKDGERNAMKILALAVLLWNFSTCWAQGGLPASANRVSGVPHAEMKT